MHRRRTDAYSLRVSEGPVSVYFSPKGGCATRLMAELERARKSVHCAIFSFTLTQVADSLISVKRRGCVVRVVFDQHQVAQKVNLGLFKKLSDNQVEVVKSANPAFMHSKYAVVDRSTVVTGSYNWTKRADEENNENLLVVRLPKIGRAYETNFKSLWNWHVEYYAAIRARAVATGEAYFTEAIP